MIRGCLSTVRLTVSAAWKDAEVTDIQFSGDLSATLLDRRFVRVLSVLVQQLFSLHAEEITCQAEAQFFYACPEVGAANQPNQRYAPTTVLKRTYDRRHFAGPVSWMDRPLASTATMTGISFTSNSWIASIPRSSNATTLAERMDFEIR